MRICIIGNGIAGITTAQELRKREPDPAKLSIEIFSREPYHFYSRIRLPEALAADLGPEDIRLYKDPWYESRAIRVVLSENAVSIDRKRKTVFFASGAVRQYDKLVLALGAEAARPPLRGFNLPGVHTLREYSDAREIRSRLLSKRSEAAVIGGGLLGLEAARQMAKTGAPVRVFEIFPRLLPRQLDSEGAGILKSVLERQGLEIILSAETESLAGGAEVEGIRLRDGRSFPAGTVLLSMGVRPNTSLAKEAGLAVGRGIQVDSGLRSSDPDIHAVGDCAEFEGAVFGIIPAAIEQAFPCAAALLGDHGVSYVLTVPRNTLKVAEIDLCSAGEASFEEGERPSARIMKRRWEGKERYEKYVLEKGSLSGAILLGSKENVNWVMSRMGKSVSARELEEKLRPDRGSGR